MIEHIYILWLRQLRRFIRSRSRIIGSLGQPLLYLFALGYGMSGVFSKAGEGNYLQFLTPGVIAQTVLFSSIFSGIEIIWDRQFGFLKETLVAPVPRIEVVIGRTLGGATVATIQGLIVLLLSFVFGFRIFSLSMVPIVIVVMLLTSILFTSVGTAIASIVNDMQGFQLIMNFLILPLYFLSGALYPLTSAPSFLQTIALFNPLTYAVDALRASLTSASHFSLALDMIVLTGIMLLAVGVSAYLFRKIQA